MPGDSFHKINIHIPEVDHQLTELRHHILSQVAVIEPVLAVGTAGLYVEVGHRDGVAAHHELGSRHTPGLGSCIAARTALLHIDQLTRPFHREPILKVEWLIEVRDLGACIESKRQQVAIHVDIDHRRQFIDPEIPDRLIDGLPGVLQ